MKWNYLALLLMLVVPVTSLAQLSKEEESRRFAEIKARFERGEKISPEERRFAQEVMARRRGAGQNPAERERRFAEYAKAHPSPRAPANPPQAVGCTIDFGRKRIDNHAISASSTWTSTPSSRRITANFLNRSCPTCCTLRNANP